MKKLLLFTLIIGGSFAVMSCGKDECECDIVGLTTTYTEEDITPDGLTLEQYCNALDATAQSNGNGSCKMK